MTELVAALVLVVLALAWALLDARREVRDLVADGSRLVALRHRIEALGGAL
jgi:hypothetical protein